MSSSEIQQLIPGSTVLTGDVSALRASAFSAASTRSLLVPVLVATLAALLLETLVVAARRRDV